MRLDYIASSPVWLRSTAYDSYLACAYVAPDGSVKCIAFADAFSPIIDTKVDVDAPLCSVTSTCNGRAVSDTLVTTKGAIELWRAGPQLVVLQGDTLHSLNAWLTTLDRAVLLVKRLEHLGTRVPRIVCGDFVDIVVQITNASSTKRAKGGVEWQANVDFDLDLFTRHVPRHVDTRPGYLFAFLPHAAPIDYVIPTIPTASIEDIDDIPVSVLPMAPIPMAPIPMAPIPMAPTPMAPIPAPTTLVECMAYHENDAWSLNTADIPFDASMSIADLLALHEESMRQFRLRTPIGVLNNVQCCMCWEPSSVVCSGCSMFSLCARCHIDVEGNCEACLFEGQGPAADACIGRRR